MRSWRSAILTSPSFPNSHSPNPGCMEVYVNGAWRSPETLGDVAAELLSASEKQAVEFIRAWREGKSTFEFRTSGSTGEPKPVSFTRQMLEASARLSIDALGLTPGMNALVSLDTRFVAGAMMIVRGLVGGMNLILHEPTSNPLKGVAERVDFLAVVPLQLRAMLHESVEELDQLSTVIIGGAPLDEELAATLEQRRPRIFATYGMTETLTHIALRKLNGPDRQRAFYPLTGVRPTLDNRGCLVIEALHLGPSPVVTNDLAAFTADGGFQILGRVDEVINSGGYKVHPRIVEEVAVQILKSLGVDSRFFVAGLPDPLLNQKVCLVIEGSPLPESVEAQLRSRLQAALKKYELPREILYRKSFVETATQKIDKRATIVG